MITIENVQNGLQSAMMQAVKRINLPAYTVRDDAPNTESALLQSYRETGKIVVWGGESDNTVWGDPAANHLFRVWHDYTHILSGLCDKVECFQPVHECAVARLQCTGLPDNLARLVMIEVAAQAMHYERFGTFVTDQVKFTLNILNG